MNQNMIGAYFHLGVSGFVCVVMFVYQSRLPVLSALSCLFISLVCQLSSFLLERLVTTHVIFNILPS